MHGREPAGDRELVELIGLRAASSARAADTLRFATVAGFAMAVVVGAWGAAVLGPFAGIAAAAVLVLANLASLAMSRSQDARARRLAEEHVAQEHGHAVTLLNVHGARPDAWRRAIDRALAERRD